MQSFIVTLSAAYSFVMSVVAETSSSSLSTAPPKHTFCCAVASSLMMFFYIQTSFSMPHLLHVFHLPHQIFHHVVFCHLGLYSKIKPCIVIIIHAIHVVNIDILLFYNVFNYQFSFSDQGHNLVKGSSHLEKILHNFHDFL